MAAKGARAPPARISYRDPAAPPSSPCPPSPAPAPADSAPSPRGSPGTGRGQGGRHAARRKDDPEKVARTVFCPRIDEDLAEVDLAQFFSVCGQVVAVAMRKTKNSAEAGAKIGWVEFDSVDAACAATTLKGKARVLGQNKLTIKPSNMAIWPGGNSLPADWTRRPLGVVGREAGLDVDLRSILPTAEPSAEPPQAEPAAARGGSTASDSQQRVGGRTSPPGRGQPPLGLVSRDPRPPQRVGALNEPSSGEEYEPSIIASEEGGGGAGPQKAKASSSGEECEPSIIASEEGGDSAGPQKAKKSSRFKGVCWSTARGRYEVRMGARKVGKRYLCLGAFEKEEEEEAGRTYDRGQIAYLGRKHAKTNFPLDDYPLHELDWLEGIGAEEYAKRANSGDAKPPPLLEVKEEDEEIEEIEIRQLAREGTPPPPPPRPAAGQASGKRSRSPAPEDETAAKRAKPAVAPAPPAAEAAAILELQRKLREAEVENATLAEKNASLVEKNKHFADLLADYQTEVRALRGQLDVQRAKNAEHLLRD